MAEITIVDKDNLGIPAIIWQGGKPMASANIDGVVQLNNGEYVAKSIGYEDKSFKVNGDAYVLMKNQDYSALPSGQIVEITAKSTGWKKWLKLGAVGLTIFGLIKLLTIKK